MKNIKTVWGSHQNNISLIYITRE